MVVDTESPAAPERVLVHGPCLQDLTDLLCFDKIVYPTTSALLRPRDLAPGYAGYPPQEPFSEDDRAKLTTARLLVAPGVLVFVPTADEIAARLQEETQTPLDAFMTPDPDALKAVAEVAFSTHELPASKADWAAWMGELDGKTRTLAALCARRGHRAVAKLYAEDFTRTLQVGWDPVLSMTFRRLPHIGTGRAPIDDIIAFLCDEETRRHRRQLRAWQSGLEAEGGGQIDPQEVPALIAHLFDEYVTWIQASGLHGGTVTRELLLVCEEPLLRALTSASAPARRNSAVELARKGLALAAEDRVVPWRELAYISHSRRNLERLWPNLVR